MLLNRFVLVIIVSSCLLLLLSFNDGVSGLASADIKNNKFRQREATDDALPAPNLYASFYYLLVVFHFRQVT